METLALFFGGWVLLSAIFNTSSSLWVPSPANVIVEAVRLAYWLFGSPFELWNGSSKNSLLSTWDQRSILRTGSSKKFCGLMVDGCRRMTTKASSKHALVIGPTGSGKTTGVIMPNLLSPPSNSSFLVYDPKSEIWARSSGYLSSIDYKVLRLIPNSLNNSVRFNPLKRALTSDKELRRFTSVIIPSDPKSESFWVDGARQLLFILVKVLSHQKDQNLHCLPVLRQLINQLGNTKQITQLVWNTKNPRIISEWQGMSRSVDAKVMSAWISHLRVSTDFLMDDQAAALVATDSMCFEDFRTDKVVLFINTGERDLEIYRPIIGLLLAQFIDEAMNDPAVEHDETARNLYFILDEFGVFARQILYLPEVVSLARSFRMCFLLGAQNFSQIIDAFGPERARSLQESLVTSIYLAGITDPQTLALLEQRLGKVDDDSGGFVTSKPLMASSEIRAMDDNHALIFHANRHGFITKMVPYFRRAVLRNRAKLPPTAESPPLEAMETPSLSLQDMVAATAAPSSGEPPEEGCSDTVPTTDEGKENGEL